MHSRGSFSIARRFAAPASIALLALSLSPELAAQPAVRHEEVRCLSRESFTQFLVEVEPSTGVRAVKLYFRASTFPEFYFVEMALGAPEGKFQAVLPLPSDETSEVVYYVEALDESFQTARSQDVVLPVSDGCRPGPGGLFFPGDPTLVIGATRAGLPGIPAGFQAAGVTGFITAAGGGAVAAGGISAGVAIGAAAGAAAGVGVVVATAGTESDGVPPGAPVGGSTTTATGTTTTTAAGNTTTSAGPTTTTAGPAATTTTPGPATTSSTTSTSSTTTSTTAPFPPAPAPLVACFNWVAQPNCWVDFDSCSTPEPIETYEWRMLGPPVADPPPTKSFSFHFGADPRCAGTMEFNRPVRLTVYDALGRSASVQENISVRPATTSLQNRTASALLRVSSRIVAFPPDGSTRGQLRVNEIPLPVEDDREPRRHEVRVASGVVRVEGTVLAAPHPGALWELDFSSSEAFVRSLQVEAGTAVVVEERRVVFRLEGGPGERLRVRFETR